MQCLISVSGIFLSQNYARAINWVSGHVPFFCLHFSRFSLAIREKDGPTRNLIDL